MCFLGCGKFADWAGIMCEKSVVFALVVVLLLSKTVHKLCSFPRPSTRISTGCTQLLRIQFPLDAADSGANVRIDPRFFFDFFNGVNSGGVVFAAEFFGDFREAEM